MSAEGVHTLIRSASAPGGADVSEGCVSWQWTHGYLLWRPLKSRAAVRRRAGVAMCQNTPSHVHWHHTADGSRCRPSESGSEHAAALMNTAFCLTPPLRTWSNQWMNERMMWKNLSDHGQDNHNHILFFNLHSHLLYTTTLPLQRDMPSRLWFWLLYHVITISSRISPRFWLD